MLTKKQRTAVEALATHPLLTDSEVARQIGVTKVSICRWRQQEEFAQALQDKLDEVWAGYGNEARELMYNLAKSGDYRAIEFLLKTNGLNPTNVVDANVVANVINVTVDDD